MHKIYEHGKFIVLEGHNQYIVVNKSKKFESGHTHINNYNTARWLIRLSEGLIVPKNISIYLVESLIRINNNPDYLRQLTGLKQSKLARKD